MSWARFDIRLKDRMLRGVGVQGAGGLIPSTERALDRVRLKLRRGEDLRVCVYRDATRDEWLDVATAEVESVERGASHG